MSALSDAVLWVTVLLIFSRHVIPLRYIVQDRIIAVHRAWPEDDGNVFSVVNTVGESPTSNFLQATGAGGAVKGAAR